MVSAKSLLHRHLKTLGDLAKGGGELLVLRFRVVIDVLSTVKAELIAHVVILRIS